MKKLLAPLKSFLKRFYDGDRAFRKKLISQGARVGENVQIVDRFGFLYEPWYADLIEIGDNVVLSAGVRLVSHDSSYSNVLGDLPVKYGEIKIGRNSYVGVNSVILCGVTIGENCIIGAGSVVNRDIPSNSIAAGNPVRVISTIEEGLAKFRERIRNNTSDKIHYIDFGGSYSQIKAKHGKDTTKAILEIYHNYFKSGKQKRN